MLKKSLIILLIIFTFICISNVCFANNTDMGNSVKNAVSNGANTLVDGAENLAKDVRNGVGHMENGIEDALTMDNTNKKDNNMSAMNNNSVGNYTATRTAATANGSDTTTMWVWVIVAVASIVIVALVWYYGSQNHID